MYIKLTMVRGMPGLLSYCCLSSSICCREKKGLRRLLAGSSGWDTDHSSKASGWRHCTCRRKFFLCLVIKWHMVQEKGFSPEESTNNMDINTQVRSTCLLSRTLTCVFDGQMGDQELFFRRWVFTKVTLKRTVVSMGQLMVEQQLFVFTSIVAEFTLEPGAYEGKCSQNTKCWRIKVQSAERKVLSPDLLSPRLWMWVRRCILNVYRFLKDLPHWKNIAASLTSEHITYSI